MFDFFGKVRGLDEETIKQRREKLFAYFGINGFEDKKINELSSGMKQKASIAVSLIHDPEVIIFDEPTTGLDIVTARSVTDYLKLMKDQGKTVIISTHIMTEAKSYVIKSALLLKDS